jgi:hypothetical protein
MMHFPTRETPLYCLLDALQADVDLTANPLTLTTLVGSSPNIQVVLAFLLGRRDPPKSICQNGASQLRRVISIA